MTASNNTEGVALSVQGRVATITIEHPERHNALGAADIATMRSHLDVVEAAPDVRVLVLTGTGSSTFCAGASIRELATGAMSGELFQTLTDRLSAVGLPTICALNGSAFGGGAEIALCCDLRIGVTGSRMQVPAAEIGICYPLGGLERWVQRLGLAVAQRVLVGGEELDAEEMLRVGFLSRLVEPEELEQETRVLADRIAGFAPLAVQAMKRLLVQIASGNIDPVAAERLARTSSDSEDLQRGLAARLGGKTARFDGR